MSAFWQRVFEMSSEISGVEKPMEQPDEPIRTPFEWPKGTDFQHRLQWNRMKQKERLFKQKEGDHK